MALDDFDTHDSAESQVAKPAPAPVPKQPTSFSSHQPTAFVPASARKAASPEDEDLFDFPVVEMKFEADAGKRPEAPLAPATAPTAAPAGAKPAAPAAALPAAPAAAAKPAPASKPALPAKEPAKAAAAPVRPQEKKDVAQAAQLVEDLEQALGSPAQAPLRARRLQGLSPLALAGVAALVLTNVLGLAFLWHTTQSYQSGVRAMNEKLAETLRHQTELQQQSAAAQPPAGGAPAPARAPLEAFELVSLQMAREEIQAGEYADARRRLSRLLAVADRIEAEAREDIEAQASFLIASTYEKQAEAAREKAP